MLTTTLALLVALAPQETAPLARFEPGSAWTYEGTVSVTATGGYASSLTHAFRARYLALAGEKAGDTLVLMWIDFTPKGTGSGNEPGQAVTQQYGTFLRLAPDLSLKSILMPRCYPHPAGRELEFSPFPPPDTPRRPDTSVAQVRALKVGHHHYRTQWDWRVDQLARGLRITLVPNALPVRALRFETTQRLLDFKQVYEIDPDSGRLLAYERTERQLDQRSHEQETTLTRNIAMRLVDAEVVPTELQESMRAEFLAALRLLFAYRPGQKVVDRQVVDEFLAELADSPVRVIARDLLTSLFLLPEGLRGRVEECQVWNRDKSARLDGAPAPAFAGKDLDGCRQSRSAGAQSSPSAGVVV
ncbi:MAG: hypothetical protein AAF628_19965 [Planctomycetota bacterium]